MKSSDHSVSFQIQANFGDKKKKERFVCLQGPQCDQMLLFYVLYHFQENTRQTSLSFIQISTVQTSWNKLKQRQKNNLNMRNM